MHWINRNHDRCLIPRKINWYICVIIALLWRILHSEIPPPPPLIARFLGATWVQPCYLDHHNTPIAPEDGCLLCVAEYWVFVVESVNYMHIKQLGVIIETLSQEDTFCDTVQVPSGGGDMQLIYIEIRHGHLSQLPVLFWASHKGHNHVPHDVLSGAGDMQLIYIEIRHRHLSHLPVLFSPSHKGHNHVPHDVRWCIFSPITAVRPQRKV